MRREQVDLVGSHQKCTSQQLQVLSVPYRTGVLDCAAGNVGMHTDARGQQTQAALHVGISKAARTIIVFLLACSKRRERSC